MKKNFSSDSLQPRDFWCFASGTLGRDFAYNFFVNYLLTFILFTKSLTDLQFTCVSVIIVGARIFDAFNDPVMGGIIENTKTRFGKFRPWIAIGALSVSVVIVLTFSIGVDGWSFIAFLAVMYFMFSITFTMNDIAYWGMLPALGKTSHERNKLMSVSQLFVTAGGGLAGICIPALTTTYSAYLGGSAASAYKYLSLIATALFLATTAITVFGVREKSTLDTENKSNTLKLKDMFNVLKNNDQLLYSALIMILYSVGTGVVTGGLSTTYIYFEFGYDGMLTTAFFALGAVLSIIFTATFPYIIKKTGRTNLILAGTAVTVFGYAFMLIVGLAVPKGNVLFELLGMKITVKYLLLIVANGFCSLGGGCFYTLMFLNMANTVEYNEWKTGKREESLIFSLRPFSAKMSSALVQLLIMVIYLAVGVLDVTNGISELDKLATTDPTYTSSQMLSDINKLLQSVDDGKKNALMCCMCIIPIIFMITAIVIYRKKFILDDKTYEKLKIEIENRKITDEITD